MLDSLHSQSKANGGRGDIGAEATRPREREKETWNWGSRVADGRGSGKAQWSRRVTREPVQETRWHSRKWRVSVSLGGR